MATLGFKRNMRILVIIISIVLLSSCSYGPPILLVENKSTKNLLSFPEKNLGEIREANFNGVSPISQVIVDKNLNNEVVFCVRSYMLKEDVLYKIYDAEVLVNGKPPNGGRSLNHISKRCQSYPEAKIDYYVNHLLSYNYDTLHQMFKNGGHIQFSYVLEVSVEGKIYQKKYSDELSASIVRYSSW